MIRKRHAPAMARGFTLIEAIIVIVISGIVAAIVALFIRSPVEGYVDTVVRSELTEAADTALRRVARDVRAALPNSLRTAGSTSCFEFLPAVGGGRYRVAQSAAPPTGDSLDFTANDISFDVLASVGLPPPGVVFPATYPLNHHVVIYNLGIPGADAYEAASVRAPIATSSTVATITLAAAKQFPFESPGRRFQVVPNFSVVYSCASGALRRSEQAISPSQMTSCPATGAILVGNVDCAQSAFEYAPAAAQRNGLLTMRLVLTAPGARGVAQTISLYQEVHVDNTP